MNRYQKAQNKRLWKVFCHTGKCTNRVTTIVVRGKNRNSARRNARLDLSDQGYTNIEIFDEEELP